MFQRMLNLLSGDKRQQQMTDDGDQHRHGLDTHDVTKYKNNLKVINYQDLLNFITQEEIYKIDNDKLASTNSRDVHQKPQESRGFLQEYEEDPFPLSIEEEYRFVLVKKAKPKPTLVMPTKILKQLQDPSEQTPSDNRL